MRAVRAIGLVAGAFAAAPGGGSRAFVTRAAASVTLDLAGIVGDRHSGTSRKAGPREPWLPRGTVMRNDRQLSAVCPAELGVVARRLSADRIEPEWLGANLLVSGLPEFSRLAPGSRLAFGGQWGGKGRFDGGAVLRVEGYNFPCRKAGRALADALGRPELEFAFVREAAELRGLVLSVEVAGVIVPGDAVVLLPPVVPKQAAADRA